MCLQSDCTTTSAKDICLRRSGIVRTRNRPQTDCVQFSNMTGSAGPGCSEQTFKYGITDVLTGWCGKVSGCVMVRPTAKSFSRSAAKIMYASIHKCIVEIKLSITLHCESSKPLWIFISSLLPSRKICDRSPDNNLSAKTK